MWQNTFFKHKYIYLFVILCLISIYLLAFGKGRSLVYKSLIDFFSPIEKSASIANFKISKIYQDINSYIWLKSQNDKLKEEVKLLRANDEILRELELENGRLKKMLDFKKETQYKLVASSVIGREPTNLFYGCIIDKGTDSGIRKNMVVITNEGLVGKIIFATSMTAKVMFIIDPNNKVSAIDQNTRSFGILTGTGKDYCLLKYLSIDDEIILGDKILTSGEGGVYPKGISIGRISKLRRSPDGSSWYIEVRPYVDFSKLEEIFVAIPK